MGCVGDEGRRRGSRGAMGSPRAADGLGERRLESRGGRGRWKNESRGVVWGEDAADGIMSRGDAPLSRLRSSEELADK